MYNQFTTAVFSSKILPSICQPIQLFITGFILTFTYAYNPLTWPAACAALLQVALAVFAWRRRTEPGAGPFILACFFGAAMAAGSVMEYTAGDIAAKIAWIKFQNVWSLPAATAVTCFILEYAWPGRWLTRRNLILFAVVPLIGLGMILTDSQHHLVWRSFLIRNGLEGSDLLVQVTGPVGWLLIGYYFLLAAVNLIVLIWLYLRSPQHRNTAVLIIFGQLSGRILVFLDKALVIHSPLPVDVLVVGYLALIYAIVLFGFRLFDPTVLARRNVMEQLADGIIVLDTQGRVASLNRAAERILGLQASQVKESPVGDILPVYPAAAPALGGEGELEFSLSTDGITRDYRLVISPLNDWRGQAAGRLLIIRDVTEQMQAQAQIIEQQRALAVLKERELLARELHDELSQDLALINLQAQTVSSLLGSGQTQQVQEQLRMLAKTARQAQVDVRGEIRTLSHRAAHDRGFIDALRHFVETFQETHGIQMELVVPAPQQRISMPAAVELQLLRIVQEAFTNIRKHARATRVRISLKQDSGCTMLAIEDDGVGFDPRSHPAGGGSFGLGIMSARAAEIGGRVELDSVPGQGTQVRVVIPLEGES